MAKRTVLIAPDPRLKAIAAPVGRVDRAIEALIDDMFETMYAAPGIGLAAPQVGESRRVIVVDVTKDDAPRQPFALINPEIIWVSDEDATYEEGCLSVPEHYADVTRPARIRVRYLNRRGVSEELDADGLLATVVQHEMDHLEGILFIDHLTSLKRSMILRKLLKARKAEPVS
jgi:peptide deformylase